MAEAFNPMSLAGRRILVTGASSGIGRATAEYAARLGASLILTGRRAEALEETRARLAAPDRHICCAGDLTEERFRTQLAGVATASGPLDGFVHAAGTCMPAPVGVLSERVLCDALRVNYFPFPALMKFFSRRGAAAPHFAAVAVSSVSATAGWAGGTAYAGSKGALSAAVRALAIELAPKGIRVNAVSPSQIATPLLDALTVPGVAEATAAAADRHALGQGSPENVAAAICFLLSDAAAFITGVDLPVDGGFLAQ